MNWQEQINKICSGTLYPESEKIVVTIPVPTNDFIKLLADDSVIVFGHKEEDIMPNLIIARDISYQLSIVGIERDRDFFRNQWLNYKSAINDIQNKIIELKNEKNNS